jgi:hypothetical protein
MAAATVAVGPEQRVGRKAAVGAAAVEQLAARSRAEPVALAL